MILIEFSLLQIDDVHRMMKELESLKAIAESQLIDLHNNLRDEREQKHIYKQQLDHRVQQVRREFFHGFQSNVIHHRNR